jgi:hypothetical protein
MIHSTSQKEARIGPRFPGKNAVDSEKKALCPQQEKIRNSGPDCKMSPN